MNELISERQREILNIVFSNQNPTYWINGIVNADLSHDKIEEACDFLSREFHMNGIDEKFEANEYGKEIEALIDVVNRPRLK